MSDGCVLAHVGVIGRDCCCDLYKYNLFKVDSFPLHYNCMGRCFLFFFTSWLHLALDASIRPQVPPSHISPQVPTACKPNWSKQPIHSFCFLGWGSWLMTWQRSSMQIANICHIASSTPYIYLLILLNISAYYRLFVGGGQWCMLPCDTVQKKAISRNPHIHSCCFF